MSEGAVTSLLQAHGEGDSEALNKLVPLVYEELYRIASNRMRGERQGHTLNTTALVHEAYLELVNLESVQWKDRQHFFALASRVMRNVLVDYAVKRKAKKRGGGKPHMPLKEGDVPFQVDLYNILALHNALERLEKLDERQVRVVECRFFGGLTIDETADALDISPATVGRDWKMARAWLNRELSVDENADATE